MPKYGEGYVYFETSRNKWHASISDPQGHRTHKRFDTEEEANAWRLSMAAKYLKGDYVVKNDTSLGTWILQYLGVFVKPKVREKTLNDYINTAAHISDEFADVQIQKLTPIKVQAYINELDTSVGMKDRLVKLLSRASRKALAIGVIEKDFMIGVEAPKPEPKEAEIFTKDELTLIMDTIDNDSRLHRHHLLIAVAIASGCRMGEILALTPNDLEENSIKINKSLVEVKGVPKLQPPKTKAGYRRITMPRNIMAELHQAAYGVNEDDYIFKNAKGKPCLTSNIDKSWLIILRRAEIPYRKFHCLRHTHATMLLAAGVPILEVAKRLGHSRPSHTLNLYGHAIPGYDSKMPSVVEKVFHIGQTPTPEQVLPPNTPENRDCLKKLQPNCNHSQPI